MIVRITAGQAALLERAVDRFTGVPGSGSFAYAPGTIGYVALQHSEIIGWCWGYELPRPDGSSMLYLHELEVAPTHRRRGVGRELLGAFIAAGVSAGASKLFLTTETANQPARSLYESLGGQLTAGGETVNYSFPLR